MSFVNETLANSLSTLEAETGLPVSLEFITEEDLITDWWILNYQYYNKDPDSWIYLPGYYGVYTREGEREAFENQVQAIIEEPMAELGYDDINYFTGNHRREITVLIPQYEIPEEESRDLYGVVEQYWIKLGSQMRIYKETNRGTYWITMGLLIVGTLFVANTTFITEIGRNKERSVQRALGWRRWTIFRVSLSETILISLLAGMITAAVLALIRKFSSGYMESSLLIAMPPIVALTFLLGSLPPMLRSLRVDPLLGIRQGEIKAGVPMGNAKPFGFVLRGLFSRPGRTAISVFAMVVPAGILAFILFIYFGLQSVLGETVLGEYLALEVRSYHFILNALVFALAGLAITDTLLVNLRVRQREFGLLKAVGWRDGTISQLLIWEGMGMGLVGGIIGTGIAVGVYRYIFGFLPPHSLLLALCLVVAPTLIGGLAGLWPAIRAARISAATAIKEE